MSICFSPPSQNLYVYVATGGPGAGKTTIIEYLAQQGELTVREAARDVITYFQEKKVQEPWKLPQFQDYILFLQQKREKQVMKEAIKKGATRIFLDRGLLDGKAYYDLFQRTPSPSLTKTLTQLPSYRKIFLIEPLSSFVKDKIRREDFKESIQLKNLQESNYKKYNFPIKKISTGALEERIAAIWKSVKKEESLPFVPKLLPSSNLEIFKPELLSQNYLQQIQKIHKKVDTLWSSENSSE